MSGGHYDYFYLKLNDFINELRTTDPEGSPHPKREQFKKLLSLVMDAAEAIEKVDSGDRSDDTEELDAILNFVPINKSCT